MKCTNCGADIPDGMMICPDCRIEVQMVPDYNPLDDVLASEVKGSVRDATRPIRSDDLRRYSRREVREEGNSTRVISQRELDRIRREHISQTARIRRSGKNDSQKQGTGQNGSSHSQQTRNNTGSIRRDNTGELRRQQQMRKKKRAKKRAQRALILFFLFVIFCGGIGFINYQNSYQGVVSRGNRALQAGDYSSAEDYFNRAIKKDVKKPEAYTGLAELYIKQQNLDKAESTFLNAVDSQPENAELYLAAIKYYEEVKQTEKISALLDGCDDKVLAQVSAYVSEPPEFSLEEGTYPEVQEIALTAGGTIYYTIDGLEPTKDSGTEYTEPILVDEGTTEIKAININKKGIPSLVSSKTYTVELPLEDAPAVTPSTGQYNTATQITIQVPEGYTAYYTLDGTTPSAASTPYTGPVDMPEGETTFSAVLISESGRMTQITKRKYVLDLQ